jgi:hypothetical protein
MTSLQDDILKMAPDESMFLEELYRAFDDVEEIPLNFEELKKLPGAGVADYVPVSRDRVTLVNPEGGILTIPRKEFIKYKSATKHTRNYGIDQYLQRVRDELPSSKGARRTANTATYTRRESAIDDITGTVSKSAPQRVVDLDKPTRLRDDFSTAYASYVKSALSQAAPYIKTDEDLRYFIEPVLKYFQIQPNNVLTSIDNVRKVLANSLGVAEDAVPEHLIVNEVLKSRLSPSKATLKTVKNFDFTLGKIERMEVRF